MFLSCLLCAGTGEATRNKMNLIPAFLELTVQQERQVLNMNVGHLAGEEDLKENRQTRGEAEHKRPTLSWKNPGGPP